MRRRTLLAVALTCGACVVPAASAGQLTQIGVGGTEFNLRASKVKVSSGQARIQFQNNGEDPHDLVIRRKGGTKEVTTGVVLPRSAPADLYLRLKRDSKYILWCSLEGHREAGMETSIKVRKK